MGEFLANVWTNIIYVVLGVAVGAIAGALVTRKYYADVAKKQ